MLACQHTKVQQKAMFGALGTPRKNTVMMTI
jgi:hypothetical protein